MAVQGVCYRMLSVEEWTSTLVVPPRACFVCHAGTDERAKWWQWDWDYVLENEQTGRLQICDVCFNAAAVAPGTPITRRAGTSDD